jgi:drug/metabolite transporter (DMT)-like permease
MPTSALVLALAAACVHALWNVLLARAPNIEAATAVALSVAVVVFAPVAWITWHVEAAAWPYIAASGALQLVYFAFLVNAYRLSELSVVYPIARGVAPVLVLVVGVVVLGYPTSFGQVLGVCLVGGGVLLVRGFKRSQGWGVPFGLAIACTIAAYTLVDKHGVAHARAIPYLEMTMLVPALAYLGGVRWSQGGAALRAAFGPATVVAGIAAFGAYALVLLALQRAAAAPVAAVRETSVVITALLARHVLKEQVGGRRLAGAVAVVGGIALLSFS